MITAVRPGCSEEYNEKLRFWTKSELLWVGLQCEAGVTLTGAWFIYQNTEGTQWGFIDCCMAHMSEYWKYTVGLYWLVHGSDIRIPKVHSGALLTVAWLTCQNTEGTQWGFTDWYMAQILNTEGTQWGFTDWYMAHMSEYWRYSVRLYWLVHGSHVRILKVHSGALLTGAWLICLRVPCVRKGFTMTGACISAWQGSQQ